MPTPKLQYNQPHLRLLATRWVVTETSGRQLRPTRTIREADCPTGNQGLSRQTEKNSHNLIQVCGREGRVRSISRRDVTVQAINVLRMKRRSVLGAEHRFLAKILQWGNGGEVLGVGAVLDGLQRVFQAVECGIEELGSELDGAHVDDECDNAGGGGDREFDLGVRVP